MSQTNFDVPASVARMQSEHAALSDQVRVLQQSPGSCDFTLQEMKQKKLRLKDQIVSQGGMTKKSR